MILLALAVPSKLTLILRSSPDFELDTSIFKPSSTNLCPLQAYIPQGIRVPVYLCVLRQVSIKPRQWEVKAFSAGQQ
jgi:hypothetical protein